MSAASRDLTFVTQGDAVDKRSSDLTTLSANIFMTSELFSMARHDIAATWVRTRSSGVTMVGIAIAARVLEFRLCYHDLGIEESCGSQREYSLLVLLG